MAKEVTQNSNIITDSQATSVDVTAGRRLPRTQLAEAKLNLSFEITELTMGDVNAQGLPELIVGAGDVSEVEAKVGRLDLRFRGAPSFLSLPPELEGNPFGLTVGQVLPAWMGPVTYTLEGGSLETMELAWVLPSKPEDPQSPLIVLSISQVSAGTGIYKDVVGGTVITKDGFAGKGSLDITLLRMPKGDSPTA